MVWVDETAVYMDMTRRRARAPRGQRVHVKRRRKYRRHTLIFAITLEGVLASKLVQGGMKREDWRSFCRDDLAPVVQKNQMIQLDNLDIHYDQEAYDALYEQGVVFIYQPMYSPEANPIEEAIALLKAHLRSVGAQCLAPLRLAIDDAFELLTPQHIAAFWRHAQQNILNW